MKRLAIVLSIVAWLPSAAYAGGWYLMEAPPKEGKQGHSPDLSYPLKSWRLLESFDSAMSCKASLTRELASYAALVAVASVSPKAIYSDNYRRLLEDATEKYLLGGGYDKILEGLPIARAVLDLKPGYLCVATDDPRLK